MHWALRKPCKRVMPLLRRAHKPRSPEWTSLAARDSAVRDGTYKRLLDAAGSTLPREPAVVTLKATQHDTLASILRTPVPEFAATRMKNVAERTEARQTLDGLLAGAHERATQGELALTAVDDEDVIVYVAGWNSMEVRARSFSAALAPFLPCSLLFCRVDRSFLSSRACSF